MMPNSATPSQVESASQTDLLSFIGSMQSGSLTFISSMTQALAWPVAVGIVVWLFHREIKVLIPKLASFKAAGIEANFGEKIGSLVPLPEPDPVAIAEEEGLPQPPQQPPAESKSDQTAPHGEDNKDVTPPPLPQTERSQRTNYMEYLNIRAEVAHRQGNKANHALEYLPIRALHLLSEARLVSRDSPRSSVTLAWRAVEVTTREGARAFDFEVLRRDSSRSTLELLMKNKLVHPWVFDRYKELNKLRNEAAHDDFFEITPDDANQYIDRAEELAANIAMELTLRSGTPKPRSMSDFN